MATVEVTIRSAWLKAHQGTSIAKAVQRYCGKRSPRVACEPLTSFLSELPDSAAVYAKYRDARVDFYLPQHTPKPKGGVSIFIGPVNKKGEQEICVEGAAHSEVRAAFFALWRMRRIPVPGPYQLGRSLREHIFEAEREILLAALQQHGWQMQVTARALSVSRGALSKKVQEHGLSDVRAAG